MTIIEAVNRTDHIKPNVYDQETKVHWLSQLDGDIHSYMSRFADGPGGVFGGYGDGDPVCTILLVDTPYDGIYQRWLEAQIDLANGEYDRYNASISLFNAEYEAFCRDYARKHRPRQAGRFLF